MTTSMNFVAALFNDYVPESGRLSTTLASTLALLALAPEESSSVWCQQMFYSLVDVLQSTLLYGGRGDARYAIIEEVRYAEWYEPTESYDYQVELKWHRDAMKNVLDTVCGSVNPAMGELPGRAALLAYRLYVMEMGFIEDLDLVAA